jgi:hypothetical protein
MNNMSLSGHVSDYWTKAGLSASSMRVVLKIGEYEARDKFNFSLKLVFYF